MKRRGMLSWIVVICLILSTFPIQAFGAEEDSKGLEQAIITAKNIISIPDNYTDFTHNSRERDTNNGKVKVWMLNWSEKEGKNGYVATSIGEDGFLYEYNKYTDEENSNSLAKVTKEQAQLVAEKFMEKAIPVYSNQMRIVENNFNSYSREEYNFTYKKFVNDVSVNFVTVNIGVNKYSGEVTYYNGGNPEFKGIEYPSLEGIMNQDEAEKAYIQKVGIDLKYYSYYDYKQKKMNIFTGYFIDTYRNKAIEAKIGQVVSEYKDVEFIGDKKDYTVSDQAELGMADSKQEFTKEENDEINSVASLITKEKAENILRETSNIIPSDAKVKNSDLAKNRIDNGYTWRISFDGAYGEVNAKSGEVLSAHCYNNDNVTKKNVNKAEAQNIAENFLKKIAPNKFVQTKYKDNEEYVLKGREISEGDNFSFNYMRQVNGIEFSSNSLRVEVDGTSGKITGYNNKWYEDVSFPSVNQVMSKEAVFKKIKELAGFSLQFTMVDKNKVGLVYNFTSKNNSYIIDPITGARLDYTGKAYKENKLPEYTDISGHWSEQTVKALLDNGYYIDGDKFNPDMNITQNNFFKYLYSPVKDNYNNDEEFYEMLIQNGVIKKEEKAPESLVSNQDVAKFVIRYLGYDKIAVHSEIFNYPFKDDVEEQYKGYAAICYGLNIIKGTDGNFDGSHNINNAEAAAIIYNLISINRK